jgi:DNA polymerase elongation subunit (family B)
VKHLGWILDLYHKSGQMVVWLKKPDGACVRLTDRWKPRIHVGGDLQNLADLACKSYVKQCRFVDKYERAGDLDKSRVLEIEVENDQEATNLANRIQREHNSHSFRLYNVDVPSPQIYLYEKDLFPLALVEAEERGGEILWSLRDSRQTLDYGLPPLRKISLEVKTERTRKIPTFADKLGMIKIKRDTGDSFEIDSDKEQDKILDLVYFFKKEDPDIVITKGGDSFIFPYLARRANANSILYRLVLGREKSPLRVYEVQGHSYFSYGKILYKDTAARLLGRLHIDEHNAFISADCGLEGLFEISRTCIIPLQRASRATIGTNMTSLQLYHAVKKQVLIPWNKNQPEKWKDNREIVDADRGGFIYGPSTGIHDNIGELDFTSLYPTIMRDENLSGETVNCKCCPDSPHRVPELDYNICTNHVGIVSQSLDILLKRRLAYKKLKKELLDEQTHERFNSRQSALKWILVCSFGYLGFKNARFGKIDAHIATCAFSRQILGHAVTLAQEHGFKLVHGIVDSMWLFKPETTDSDYETLAALLRKQIGIPLSYEGRYKWIVFLNSKTEKQSQVLNRYYGIFQDKTLKIRGIDLRRHDTPGIVRECQNRIFSTLSEAENTKELKAQVPKVVEIIRESVSRLEKGDVAIEDLVIIRSLSKSPHEYSHKVPQGVAAQYLKNNGGSVHAGQQISYILTLDKKNNETTATAHALAGPDTVYDPKRYVDLLISSAANLLQPIGLERNLLSRILNEDH